MQKRPRNLSTTNHYTIHPMDEIQPHHAKGIL
jgi:hypothetical protein